MFDYQCEKCGKTESYVRNQGESIKLSCAKEGGKGKCEFKQYFGNAATVFDIAAGRTGNAKNGYSNTITNEPGKFTPMNKLYGAGGRQGMFDKDGRVSGGGKHSDSSSDWA